MTFRRTDGWKRTALPSFFLQEPYCSQPAGRATMTAMSDGDLVKAKIGVPAANLTAEVAIGQKAPSILAKLLAPKRWAKARATGAIAASIVDRITKGGPLSSADAAFMRDIGDEASAKWIRRREIEARAEKVIEATASSPSLSLPPSEQGIEDGVVTETKDQSADDWISHFWDDAGLVSDEVLQEVYARILVSEAKQPGSCSQRTLRVLRYLDRKTAERFAIVLKATLDYSFIPNDRAIEAAFGIDYGILGDLDDAGLLDSNAMLFKQIRQDPFFLVYGRYALVLRNTAGLRIPNFPLRRAGQELARVAEIDMTTENFLALADWIAHLKDDMSVAWSEMPKPQWEGQADSLSWTVVKRSSR